MINNSIGQVSRRSALAGMTCTGAMLLVHGPLQASVVQNRIVQENALPGTRDWMVTQTRTDPIAICRSPSVEGYASHTSIIAGETLQLMISTMQATHVDIDIYRMGYYGGLGGRFVRRLSSIPTKQQPTPEPSSYRLMACNWDASAQVEIDRNWLSGVYLAKLTEHSEGLQSYIIFIVRDERSSDIVYQCSDHTWQAYNRWPSEYSLYDTGDKLWHWGDQSSASFNRPYGKYRQIVDSALTIGSGEFFLWEGYDVTYVSNCDTHNRSESSSRGKCFLSVGHDEYWTMEMYESVKLAIESGTHVGFFSGNAVCGKVIWDPITRSIRRVGVFGPPGGTHEFSAMSTLKHERPYANELIGAHSTGPVTGGADWICTIEDHWLYKDTRMKNGDRIPGVIGWEYHGDPAPIPGLQIMATGPTQSSPGVLNGGTYTATLYQGPKNNMVFNASTCWWADGLSAPPGYQSPMVYTAPQGVDARIQQITRNFLERSIR
jgi:hypothetical protein